MPWRDPPRFDFDEQPEFRWPFWQVGHKRDDLFGVLHDRFNTTSMFIQDPDAFHHDVAELASSVSGREEFLTKLQDRRDQRLNELKDFQMNIAALIMNGFNSMNDDQMKSFINLCRNASFDSLIAFWVSFLAPDRYGIEPSLDEFKQTSIPSALVSLASHDAAVSSPADTRKLGRNIIQNEKETVSEPVTTFAKRKRKRALVPEQEMRRQKSQRLSGSLPQTAEDDSTKKTPLQTIKPARQTNSTSSRLPPREIQRAESKTDAGPKSQHPQFRSTTAKNRRATSRQKVAAHSPSESKRATRSSRRLAGKTPVAESLS